MECKALCPPVESLAGRSCVLEKFSFKKVFKFVLPLGQREPKSQLWPPGRHGSTRACYGAGEPRRHPPLSVGSFPAGGPGRVRLRHSASGLGGPWRTVGSRDSHGVGRRPELRRRPTGVMGTGCWLPLFQTVADAGDHGGVLLLPLWAAAWQWPLGVCRIVVSATRSLRRTASWHPQGLRGHLLQPDAGTARLLEASAPSSMQWADHTHGRWSRAPRELAPFQASLVLTPASACTPLRPESSLPPCQERAWPEPRAPHSG